MKPTQNNKSVNNSFISIIVKIMAAILLTSAMNVIHVADSLWVIITVIILVACALELWETGRDLE